MVTIDRPTTKYEDGTYRWVKVKRFTLDESQVPSVQFQQLWAHHIEESTFLVEEVRRLAGLLNRAESLLLVDSEEARNLLSEIRETIH